MSELEAKSLLEAAERFVEAQRASREVETKPVYHREGSNVVLGEPRDLAPNFAASYDSEASRAR